MSSFPQVSAGTTINPTEETMIRHLTGPTKLQWEQNRAHIKWLYIDKGKTLKEVISIMKQRGFNASKKMFMDRIKLWDIQKNIKRNQAVAILDQRAERNLVGKQSAVIKHGKAVKVERLLRHLKANAGSLAIDGNHGLIPPHIRCRTPPHTTRKDDLEDDLNDGAEEIDIESSGTSVVGGNRQIIFNCTKRIFTISTNIPGSLSSPREFSILEELLYSLRVHHAGSFENGIWMTNKTGFCSIRSISEGALPLDPGVFSSCCTTAVNLKRKGSLINFRRMLSKAFGLIQALLQAPTPLMISQVFSTFFLLHREGLFDVSSLLREYMHELATSINTIGYPLRRIFQLVAALDDESFLQALAQSWRFIVETFNGFSGVFGETSLSSRLQFIRCVHGFQDPLEEEKILRELWAECKRIPRVHTARNIEIIQKLALNMLKQGKAEEAEKLARVSLSLLEVDTTSYSVLPHAHALELIAYSQKGQNKRDLAKESFEHCLEIISSAWGTSDPWAMSIMAILEQWLRKWEREEEANELKRRIEHLVELDETDMERNNSEEREDRLQN